MIPTTDFRSKNRQLCQLYPEHGFKFVQLELNKYIFVCEK